MGVVSLLSGDADNACTSLVGPLLALGPPCRTALSPGLVGQWWHPGGRELSWAGQLCSSQVLRSWGSGGGMREMDDDIFLISIQHLAERGARGWVWGGAHQGVGFNSAENGRRVVQLGFQAGDRCQQQR